MHSPKNLSIPPPPPAAHTARYRERELGWILDLGWLPILKYYAYYPVQPVGLVLSQLIPHPPLDSPRRAQMPLFVIRRPWR